MFGIVFSVNKLKRVKRIRVTLSRVTRKRVYFFGIVFSVNKLKRVKRIRVTLSRLTRKRVYFL